MTDQPRFPEQRPDAPNFEVKLQNVLHEAARLPGQFTVERVFSSAEIVYQEEPLPEEPNEPPAIAERLHRVDVQRLDAGCSPRDAYAYALSNQNALIETVRTHLITRRQAGALIHAMRHPDLRPSDLGTITTHALGLLPHMAAAYPIHNQPYHSYVAHALTRRALDLDPETSAETFALVADLYNQHIAQPGEIGAAYATTFISTMISRLENTMATAKTGGRDTQPRAGQWRYDPQGEYIEHNTLSALEIFDGKGLISLAFWQKLLGVPWASQSLGVLNLLAEKLHTSSNEIIPEKVTATERSRLLENAVGAALERAMSHAARSQELLANIREVVITGGTNQPAVVSLSNLVRLADRVMQQYYPGEYTPLQVESSFADAGRALSFLLQKTLRSEAGPAEQAQAKEEAEVFRRLMSGIFKQTPIIRTIGDLALHFPGANDGELDVLRAVYATEGLGAADAFRKQQRKNQRLDTIYRPGYGQLS